jgi:hypothetical protein
MFEDPIYTAFIIYVVINALILIRVWWLAIEALAEFLRG